MLHLQDVKVHCWRAANVAEAIGLLQNAVRVAEDAGAAVRGQFAAPKSSEIPEPHPLETAAAGSAEAGLLAAIHCLPLSLEGAKNARNSKAQQSCHQ
jgi:hypothetical protein